MAQGFLRLGRLGLFVAMAGVSWFIEACGGTSGGPNDPTGKGGAVGAGTTRGSGGATSSTGIGIGSGTAGSGGEGGLHDIPCE